MKEMGGYEIMKLCSEFDSENESEAKYCEKCNASLVGEREARMRAVEDTNRTAEIMLFAAGALFLLVLGIIGMYVGTEYTRHEGDFNFGEAGAYWIIGSIQFLILYGASVALRHLREIKNRLS